MFSVLDPINSSVTITFSEGEEASDYLCFDKNDKQITFLWKS